MQQQIILETPLGRMRLRAEDGAVTGLDFAAPACREPDLSAALPAAEAAAPPLREAVHWTERYFRGEDPGPVPPLRPAGTAFQQRVWSLAAAIPRGETRSYGALAGALGSSARAVGQALGQNPILLLIPCHRVLGADGRLVGYAAGLERKAFLLDLEARAHRSFPPER